jgi:hypothetical protein
MISKGRIPMPCFLALLVVLFPRIAIVLLYLFTNFFRGVYDSLLLPLLGFIFLPFTLLAYTALINMHQPHDSTFLVVLFVAVIVDLGLVGGGNRIRRSG